MPPNLHGHLRGWCANKAHLSLIGKPLNGSIITDDPPVAIIAQLFVEARIEGSMILPMPDAKAARGFSCMMQSTGQQNILSVELPGKFVSAASNRHTRREPLVHDITREAQGEGPQCPFPPFIDPSFVTCKVEGRKNQGAVSLGTKLYHRNQASGLFFTGRYRTMIGR
jgi:hypothetical protein